MKIDLIKTANGKFWPVDEEGELKISKLKKGDVYSADIKVNHNYELHKKIFGFFAFCVNYYYGDVDASKCPYQVDRLRKKLTIAAGYHKQVFNRDGIHFEIVALSLKYESMPDDERQLFYKRMTQAALNNVFNDGADKNIINQLLSWF
tara:strand:- start:7217 stop:7660 length:444 start_codon:yes stop_codon:yes gene_type:complete